MTAVNNGVLKKDTLKIDIDAPSNDGGAKTENVTSNLENEDHTSLPSRIPGDWEDSTAL